MNKLWQLKKISTNEPLNTPQKLPENWGPIFGLSGIKEKLSDLSWLGPNYEDQGWFELEEIVDENLTKRQEILNTARQLLKDSDWTMLFDVPMNKETKEKWMNYRKILREIHLQPGFPEEISWPIAPE